VRKIGQPAGFIVRVNSDCQRFLPFNLKLDFLVATSTTTMMTTTAPPTPVVSTQPASTQPATPQSASSQVPTAGQTASSQPSTAVVSTTKVYKSNPEKDKIKFSQRVKTHFQEHLRRQKIICIKR
jgi:hypothetical protein